MSAAFFQTSLVVHLGNFFPAGRGRAPHSHTLNPRIVAYLAGRAWLMPTVAPSSASSGELLGLSGYRDVQHTPSCGFARHLARIHDGYSKTLVHASCTHRHYGRRSLSTRRGYLGLGISRRAILARARATQSLIFFSSR